MAQKGRHHCGHIHNLLSKQHSWCRLRSTQQSGQVSSSIHSWYHHEIAYNHNFILPCNIPSKIPKPETSLTVIACYYAIVRDPSWRASSARFPTVVGFAFCDAFARQKDAKSAYSNTVTMRDETWTKGWKDMKGWNVAIWPSYTQLPSPKPTRRHFMTSCGFRSRTDLRIQLGSIGQSVQSDPGCCHFLTKHGGGTNTIRQTSSKEEALLCCELYLHLVVFWWNLLMVGRVRNLEACTYGSWHNETTSTGWNRLHWEARRTSANQATARLAKPTSAADPSGGKHRQLNLPL